MKIKSLIPHENDPRKDKEYVVSRTTNITFKNPSLQISVVLKNLHDPNDCFICEVSIYQAVVALRPTTVWKNGEYVRTLDEREIAQFLGADFEVLGIKDFLLDSASLSKDPIPEPDDPNPRATLNDPEKNKNIVKGVITVNGQKTNVPTRVLKFGEVEIQSFEFMAATYGAHELIHDLIRYTPDQVLDKHCRDGLNTKNFTTEGPYDVTPKGNKWQGNPFAHTLLAYIRHNKDTYNIVKSLYEQYAEAAASDTNIPFLLIVQPWHREKIKVSGMTLKNKKTGKIYLWNVTAASIPSTIVINLHAEYVHKDDMLSGGGMSGGRRLLAQFVDEELQMEDESPSEDSGTVRKPFETALVGEKPTVVSVKSFVKRGDPKRSISGTVDQFSGRSVSGNDPYGSGRGVAILQTGDVEKEAEDLSKQVKPQISNMELMVQAAQKLKEDSKILELSWVSNYVIDQITNPSNKPAILPFKPIAKKNDDGEVVGVLKTWSVFAFNDDQPIMRGVMFFKFLISKSVTVYAVEIETDINESYCVLFFTLPSELDAKTLELIMRTIAFRKGVMKNVKSDSNIVGLDGWFNVKKHWVVTDNKPATVESVATWLENKLDEMKV